jgi:hypothetical protein
MRRTAAAILVFLCSTLVLVAQQASIAQVEESLEASLALAKETVETLNTFQQGGSPETMLQRLGEIQSAFRPVLLAITETTAPEGARRFAMNVALGAKSVELATWYYMYGLLGRDQSYLEQGDTLFRRGLVELEVARQMPR